MSFCSKAIATVEERYIFYMNSVTLSWRYNITIYEIILLTMNRDYVTLHREPPERK